MKQLYKTLGKIALVYWDTIQCFSCPKATDHGHKLCNMHIYLNSSHPFRIRVSQTIRKKNSSNNKNTAMPSRGNYLERIHRYWWRCLIKLITLYKWLFVYHQVHNLSNIILVTKIVLGHWSSQFNSHVLGVLVFSRT